jgi:hypothetical protein
MPMTQALFVCLHNAGRSQMSQHHRAQAARELCAPRAALIILRVGALPELFVERVGRHRHLAPVAAVMVGDRVAGKLVGEGVEAVCVTQAGQASVQPQQDLLGEVVVNRLVGGSAGDERAQARA